MDEKEQLQQVVERVIKLETKEETHSKDITDIKKDITLINSTLSQQNIASIRLESKVDGLKDFMNDKFNSFSEEFSKIKEEREEELTRPSKEITKIKWGIISALITGILTYILTSIFK